MATLIFCVFITSASALEIGVNTHMGQAGRAAWSMVLNTMKDLGVSSYRDEIYWGVVETTDKNISMSRTPREMLSALNARPQPFKPLFVADYGNANYDRGAQPSTTTGRQAYARYTAALVKSYGDRTPYVELWNEWNLGAGNKSLGKGSAESYAALVKTAAPAIRTLNAPVKIIAGAAGDDLNDWAWTKGVVNAGVLSVADGYSVHLYNYSAGLKATPEEMFARLERLQVILRDANAGQEFPVYITEVGWPTYNGTGGTVPELAGAYLARFLLEASGYPWIKGIWFYELLDGGVDATDREQNFGLYNSSGKAKPGTCNVKKAIGILENYVLVSKGTQSNGIRWLQLENRDKSSTIFVTFSSVKKGSGTAKVTKAISSLCEFGISPPNPPKISGVIESIETDATIGVAKSPSTTPALIQTFTEMPVVAVLAGVGHKPIDFFAN